MYRSVLSRSDLMQSMQIHSVPSVNSALLNILLTALSLISTGEGPVVTVVSTTSTTIQLSWTSSGPEIDSYEVMWVRDTTGECFEEHMNNTTINDDSFTSYNTTITRLEENSSYIIIVFEINVAWSAVSVQVIGMTMEAGEAKHITLWVKQQSK